MKKITIANSQNLNELSSCLFIEVNALKELIVSRLVSNGVLFDIEEECGVSVGEHISESEFTLGGASLLLFGDVSPKIKELLSKLIIWGIPNECPLCGCATYYEGEYEYEKETGEVSKVIWEIKHCSNCDFSEEEDNEPDPDFYRDDDMLP